MSVDRMGYYRITVVEALSLPNPDLRDLFARTVNELKGELAEIFTKQVDFLDDDERIPETMTTQEMREAIIRHQYWFNPKEKAPVE